LFLPKNIESMADKIRAVLEQEGFVDTPLQSYEEGQLWGLVKDNLPEERLQLHVRAFYADQRLLFRAHTEPSRFDFEHIPERFRSYGEGTRMFMDITKQHGIEIKYEGNVLDLYVEPERPKTQTPWIPYAVLGAIIFFIVLASLEKPPEE